MASQSPLTQHPGERVLTGWGRTAPSAATVVTALSLADIQETVAHANPRGVLARGMGRSYGDAAQAAGGTVLDLSPLTRVDLDRTRGVVTTGAGVSLDYLLRLIVPEGFFVPVTPGTRMVSVAGAIAADVHGKSHHVEGTFGSHVSSLTMVDGTGALSTLSPTSTPQTFWATVGGMGLTGVITEATFDLVPITSSLMTVDTERTADLDDLMARMVEGDDRYRYSVAWVDSAAPSGRGVLTRGDHAPAGQLPARRARDPLAYDPKTVATAPSFFPSFLLNTLSAKAFNEAWFRKAPAFRQGELQSIGAFFHPLDGVQAWNRVYGPGGFLQYQFAVPDAGAHLVARTLQRLRDVGAPSYVTVLKRFGAANPAPLSFPQPGWTLAIDVPARVPGLAAVLDELDRLVLAEGGRLYLAKDSRMSPEMMAASYPRLSEWQRVRDRMDPDRKFTSDLARRLLL